MQWYRIINPTKTSHAAQRPPWVHHPSWVRVPIHRISQRFIGTAKSWILLQLTYNHVHGLCKRSRQSLRASSDFGFLHPLRSPEKSHRFVCSCGIPLKLIRWSRIEFHDLASVQWFSIFAVFWTSCSLCFRRKAQTQSENRRNMADWPSSHLKPTMESNKGKLGKYPMKRFTWNNFWGKVGAPLDISKLSIWNTCHAASIWTFRSEYLAIYHVFFSGIYLEDPALEKI